MQSGVPLRVTCYDYYPLLGKSVESRPLNSSNKWAAGGFVSTPSELVHLGNELLRGRIVTKETMEMLFTPQKLKSGKENDEGYAMGWRSGRMRLPSSGREVRVAHHGGVANGAMTFFVVFPDEDVVVVLSCNLSFKPFWEFGKQSLAVAEHFLDRAS
jgi:CubicO group peptidase (beta-lactamase class C family)